VLATSGKQSEEVLAELLRLSDRVVFVFALSPQATETANSAAATRLVLWRPDAIARVLEAERPLDVIKQAYRDQVPRHLMIPFDTERPAEGGMFTGRYKYLQSLKKVQSSFALVGPSRVGKTSLLRRFREDLVRSADLAMHSTFYISLYHVAERSDNGLARLVAMRIDGKKSSNDMTLDRLEQFLRFWRGSFGRPVDFLLDEVDEVLSFEFFDTLEHISRMGYCRAVLAGKSSLLREMLNPKRAFACRLDLLRLESLSATETESLFIQPLLDLGFGISRKEELLRALEDLSGHMPHWVQFYGKAVAQLACEKNIPDISPELIYAVRDSFEVHARCISAILNLADSKVQSAAQLLLTLPRRPMTVSEIQGVFRDHNIASEYRDTWTICNDLVLANVLSWSQGRMEVANGSLIHHAKLGGLI
jgi:hypothetical protein